MALHYGASNLQLGYISSALYLTGMVALFIPVLFSGKKIINLFFGAWLLRGLICLLYGTTELLPYSGAVLLIITVYTLYCLLRNVAYPLNPVIQGMLTRPSERGNFASQVIMVLYTSMMLSRFISFGGLSLFGDQEIRGIQALILLGILLNTLAALAVRRVPVKEKIHKTNLKQTLRNFLTYLNEPQKRLLILLFCSGMSLIVLFNFTIPFLRKEVGLPSNMIFIYTTTNFLGVIISSRLARPFMDRFGSRPLLTLVSFVIVVISLFWFFALPSAPLWHFFLLGFISMFFIGMIRLLVERLVVNSIPEDDRVGFSASVAVVFSLISLGVGLTGGKLADITNTYDLPVAHEYSLTFAFLGLISLFTLVFSIFFQEKESLPALKLLKLMLQPKHLKTIHKIDTLKRTSSPVRKETILIELESDHSHLATQEIRKRLKMAILKDKEMVIRSLFSHPRPELEEELIAEAQDPYSWWRQSAIFALGAYKSRASRQVLRRVMKENYPYVRSIAAKSLARIGDDSCRNEIKELLQEKGLDVRTYLNLMISLSIMEKDGSYWDSLFPLITRDTSHRFVQSLLIIGARRQNFHPPLEDFFYELNLSVQGGFDTLFEELADIELTQEELDQLQKLAASSDYRDLWKWCRDRLKSFTLLEPYEPLRRNILEYKKRTITPTMAAGVLYFTLQLELIHNRDIGTDHLFPE